MTDIAEFLTARLDEDESTARAAIPGPWVATENRATPLVAADLWGWTASEADYGEPITDDVPRDTAVHIARWDPARVLAEIVAKRAIVEDYQIVLANNAIEKANDGDEVQIAARDLIAKSLLMVLRRLVTVWSAHPDYDPAWKSER